MISIIVTTFNSAAWFARFVESIEWQTQKPDEIIVADDGSSRGELAHIKKIALDSKLTIRCFTQEDLGFRAAAVRNLGILNSKSEYLLFFDSDILLSSSVIETHCKNAAKGRFLVGNRAMLDRPYSGQILFGDDPLPCFATLWQQADKSHLSPTYRKFKRQLIQRKLHVASRHRPSLLGCHFSIHRDDLLGVNGFDENYVGWGYEDDDLVVRLYASGMSPQSVLREAPAVHLWHQARTQVDKGRQQSVNREYFLRKDIDAYCRNGVIKQVSE